MLDKLLKMIILESYIAPVYFGGMFFRRGATTAPLFLLALSAT